MSVERLVTRIDEARDGVQQAKETLSGAREKTKPAEITIGETKAADDVSDAQKARDAARGARGGSGRSGGTGNSQGTSGGGNGNNGDNSSSNSSMAEPPQGRRKPGTRVNKDGSSKSPTLQEDTIREAGDRSTRNRRKAIREGVDGQGTTTVDRNKRRKSRDNVRKWMDEFIGAVRDKYDEED